MSIVDHVLSRHGLRWELNPYRIVVGSNPHLIVQAGPSFDLRESALKVARERTLAAERKRRQRARLGASPMSREVAPTEQSKASIRGHLAISDMQNCLEVQNNHGQSTDAASDGI
jgi:hypothetical protein